MNSRERVDLDAYLTQSPPDDEEDDFCEGCGVVASACEQPEEHAASWVTYTEHMQAQAEEWASERWMDGWE